MPEETVQTSPALRSWNRTQRLRKLGYDSYDAYLRSPAWAGVKRRYRASLRPQDCGMCGTQEEIQIHHLTYERVGEEELSDLTALCGPCHSMLHALERRGDITSLDFDGLIDSARAERNRARMKERLGDAVVPNARHRHERDHQTVLAFAKQMLRQANNRDIDTTDEVARIRAIADELNARMMDEAA